VAMKNGEFSHAATPLHVFTPSLKNILPSSPFCGILLR
jgi:hypothetical protein